ncbi:MAG: ABC transporter substrate-binding protein [Firmicutes bacterium]|nr:ABC transporter substrate-binding protein [Bacillota bacterium]
MKKYSLLIIIALLLCAMIAFAGCNSQQEPANMEDSDTAADEVQTILVGRPGLDIKIAAIIAAYQTGYYEEEGVNVEFETISNLNDGVTAVSTQKLDVLPFGVIPSATFISQGTDVVIFGGTISEGSEGVTLPENADRFKSLDGFQGARLACYRMETGHMVMKGLLREHGYNVGMLNEGADVEIVYMDSMASCTEAVQKGDVDIAMVNSGYGYVAQQAGLAVSFQVGDFQANFPCCRQTTSRYALENKFDALVKFTIANLRGYELLMTDKDAAIQCLADYSGQDAAYVENVIYGTDGYDAAMIVSLDPSKNDVEKFYQVMKDNGDIDADTPYDIADNIDTTVYQTALETLIEREPDNKIWADLMTAFEAHNL